MLIRFDTKSGTITTFGDVGKQLLRLMGQSGDVPGALRAADIPAAVNQLKTALAQETDPPKQDPRAEDGGETPVGLKTRALPLIELLERAASRGDDVLWEDENRRVV